MPLTGARTRRKGKANEESPSPASSSESATSPAQAQQMPAYAQGRGAVVGVPLLDGGVQAQQADEELVEPKGDELNSEPETPANEKDAEGESAKEDTSQSVTPVPDVSGVGKEIHATAYSLTLQGRTDATFPSSFRTVGVRTSAATGCAGCDAGDCVRVRGTLVSTYAVTTTVTLPSVNDFPDLTPCQRRRVQDAITRVLSPHEQRHVRAFSTYNATTRQAFDMTICRSEVEAAIQSLHDAEQSTRQAAAQARSDALDPFQFDVDLDCEEPAPRVKRSTGAGAAPQAVAPESQPIGADSDELQS